MLKSTKILSAISLILATLTLLVFAIVPHHHHGDAICVVMEHCIQNDNSHNDHNSCGDAKHNTSCVTEAEFVASNDNLKCKVSSCDNHSHNHHHILPLICVFLDAVLGDVDILIYKYEYGEHRSFYKSAYVGQGNALRAPPVIGVV